MTSCAMTSVVILIVKLLNTTYHLKVTNRGLTKKLIMPSKLDFTDKIHSTNPHTKTRSSTHGSQNEPLSSSDKGRNQPL